MSKEEEYRKPLLAAVEQYVNDAEIIAKALKEVGLKENNVPLIMIQQGSLDTLYDIKLVLAGGNIMSLKEMVERAKETTDDQSYLR